MKYQILYTTRTGHRSASKASSLNEAIIKAQNYCDKYGCLCLVYEETSNGMKFAARVTTDKVERR